MDNLNSTSFNDGKILALIRNMTLGYGRKTYTAISNDEKILIEHEDEIISLNRKMERNLYNVVNNVRDWIPAADAVFFLIEADKADRLEEAIDCFETIKNEETNFTLSDLEDLLKDDSGMPLSWGVLMLGDNKGSRLPEAPQYDPWGKRIREPKKSSIDLNRLRDFK